MVKKLIDAIAEAWVFFRKEGIIGTMRSKDAPWLVQFGKYGVCGVMATIVAQSLFFLFAKTIFPSFDMEMDKWQRAWNWTYANLLAFVFANTFVYFANLAFVFEGGRHHRVKEFLFFSLVNFVSTLAAIIPGFIAIINNVETPYAQLIFIIVAVLVNFLARKFFVFKG